MSWFKRLFLSKARDEPERYFTLEEWGDYLKKNTTGSDLSEVTYYICLKVLSESLGKLSIHLKDKDNEKILDHDSLQILKFRPNPFMTPATFKALLEFSRNHYGNAYAYIRHNKAGKLIGIYPLESRRVRILINNTGALENKKIIYEYLDDKGGRPRYFANEEILHLKGGLSQEGIVGMCVRETLARTLEGSKESQAYLNNLYKNGLTAKAILKYVGDFSKEKRKELIRQVMEDVGTDKSNIASIPMGFDLIPLDLKLTDSQFYELKKHTALQIAAAFGVKPNHVNNYEKSSYANSEMQNLTFYIDTLLYILTLYEEELNYKLLTEAERQKGYRFEFNVASILRGDLKTQAEAITKYVTGGVYKINEARKLAGLPPIKEGDIIVINGSYVTLDKVGAAYPKGGEGNGETAKIPAD